MFTSQGTFDVNIPFPIASGVEFLPAGLVISTIVAVIYLPTLVYLFGDGSGGLSIFVLNVVAMSFLDGAILVRPEGGGILTDWGTPSMALLLSAGIAWIVCLVWATRLQTGRS